MNDFEVAMIMETGVGREFLCMVQGDGKQQMSRMYIHG